MILHGVEFSIFLLIFAYGLRTVQRQCAACDKEFLNVQQSCFSGMMFRVCRLARIKKVVLRKVLSVTRPVERCSCCCCSLRRLWCCRLMTLLQLRITSLVSQVATRRCIQIYRKTDQHRKTDQLLYCLSATATLATRNATLSWPVALLLFALMTTLPLCLRIPLQVLFTQLSCFLLVVIIFKMLCPACLKITYFTAQIRTFKLCQYVNFNKNLGLQLFFCVTF